MIKKLKEYFKVKRDYKTAKKALILLIMQQYSTFLDTQSELQKTEKELYDKIVTLYNGVNAADIEELMNNISKLTNDPKLTTEYYQQISRQAYAEKVEESKQKNE